MLKFPNLSNTLLKKCAPVGTTIEDAKALEVSLQDLHDGWLVEAVETLEDRGESTTRATEESDLKDESGDDDDLPEAVDERVGDFDAEAEYGANIHSLVLLDVLSDQPIEGEGAELVEGSLGNNASTMAPTVSSAKKDTSGVDLEGY